MSGTYNQSFDAISPSEETELLGGTDQTKIGNVGDSLKANVTASALPTGASTAANQSTEITSLQIIDDIPHTNNAALSKGIPVMGQLDDTSTETVTENNVSTVRITSTRGLHTNLRNASGTEVGTSGSPLRIDPTGTTTQPVNIGQYGGVSTTLGQKASANSIPVVLASDQSTLPVNAIPSDGSKATYSATIKGLVLASSATDFFTITGSASKIVRITNISWTSASTAAAQSAVILLKRSTANSAGTSTTRTAVPHDSTSSSATATVRAYTANPTIGTLVGNIKSVRNFSTGTASAAPSFFSFNFGDGPFQALVLRGTSEILALNFNGVTVSGLNFDISITWTEE